MRELVPTDRWTTSPRGPGCPTVVRPRSSRLVYRPSVQDLSEQAARNGNNYHEETILSVINTVTPRQSRPGSENLSDRLSVIAPSVSQYSADDVITKASSNTPLCFHQQNSDYYEDLHRQRVLVSAHQRRKIHSIRRTKSMPGSGKRSVSGLTDLAHNKQGPPDGSEDDPVKLELVVTNSSRVDDKGFKDRINYKLANRAKPKGAHGTLMAGGTPMPVLNGYNQNITQNHPKYSLRYMNWLTNGLKVQSFHAHPLKRFCHSKPRPPPVQYLNRPKTINGHFPRNRGTGSVDFNVVGVQKEVLGTDSQSCSTIYKTNDPEQSDLLLE